MALIADEKMGHITRDDLYISVEGPPCLGDVLQGLTHARIANPPRFTFYKSSKKMESVWSKGKEKLVIKTLCVPDKDIFLNMKDEDLFDIEQV